MIAARLTAVIAALALVLTIGVAAAAADWHSEQPVPAGGTVPVPLGRVYDIAFWASNRGLLITADGLWAYDGTGWRRHSTVCGGEDGRIVWAGPLEFWTISEQPVGQPNPFGESTHARSLCHFVNGSVVASYAQPLGQSTSYLPMSGGACLTAGDCWFGGARLPGTVNSGAFHLHWDGAKLSAWPSLVRRDPSVFDPARSVTDLVTYNNSLYEAVAVEGNEVPSEPAGQPFLLHELLTGEPPAFSPLIPLQPVDYGTQAPTALGGPVLSADGDALWAAASPLEPTVRPVPPAILRMDAGGLTRLELNDPAQLLKPDGTIAAIAAEPGTGSAWIGYVPPGEAAVGAQVPARLARVYADGRVEEATALPSSADGISRKQQADRIACPEAGQCWMATASGWLFHLGDSLPRDDAPAMHRLITYRPSDAATVSLPPDSLPDDSSGIAPPVIDQPPPEGYTPPGDTDKTTKAKKLVKVLGRKLVVRGRTTLELTISLSGKARVQLVAKRKKTVVARTKQRTLAKGKHKLRLKLDRRKWPTALDLKAEPYKKGGGVR